jgi:Uma2 family endonuclease
LLACLPSGWLLRTQQAITLADSEPEPDFTVARGDKRTYLTRHPGPADVGLVVEVADTSLQRDRDDKARIYARAGIATYWIVNLIDRQVEVRTGPASAAGLPAYAQRQDFAPGSRVPFTLGAAVVASVPVDELLP